MCHAFGTWFGYYLQAELHCAIGLYSLIEETVIRVELRGKEQIKRDSSEKQFNPGPNKKSFNHEQIMKGVII